MNEEPNATAAAAIAVTWWQFLGICKGQIIHNDCTGTTVETEAEQFKRTGKLCLIIIQQH